MVKPRLLLRPSEAHKNSSLKSTCMCFCVMGTCIMASKNSRVWGRAMACFCTAGTWFASRSMVALVCQAHADERCCRRKGKKWRHMDLPNSQISAVKPRQACVLFSRPSDRPVYLAPTSYIIRYKPATSNRSPPATSMSAKATRGDLLEGAGIEHIYINICKYNYNYIT